MNSRKKKTKNENMNVNENNDINFPIYDNIDINYKNNIKESNTDIFNLVNNKELALKVFQKIEYVIPFPPLIWNN
jgi:hypothetical protein